MKTSTPSLETDVQLSHFLIIHFDNQITSVQLIYFSKARPQFTKRYAILDNPIGLSPAAAQIINKNDKQNFKNRWLDY